MTLQHSEQTPDASGAFGEISKYPRRVMDLTGDKINGNLFAFRAINLGDIAFQNLVFLASEVQDDILPDGQTNPEQTLCGWALNTMVVKENDEPYCVSDIMKKTGKDLSRLPKITETIPVYFGGQDDDGFYIIGHRIDHPKAVLLSEETGFSYIKNPEAVDIRDLAEASALEQVMFVNGGTEIPMEFISTGLTPQVYLEDNQVQVTMEMNVYRGDPEDIFCMETGDLYEHIIDSEQTPRGNILGAIALSQVPVQRYVDLESLEPDEMVPFQYET